MTSKDADLRGKPNVEFLDIDFKFINALAKKDDSSVDDTGSKKRQNLRQHA